MAAGASHTSTTAADTDVCAPHTSTATASETTGLSTTPVAAVDRKEGIGSGNINHILNTAARADRTFRRSSTYPELKFLVFSTVKTARQTVRVHRRVKPTVHRLSSDLRLNIQANMKRKSLVTAATAAGAESKAPVATSHAADQELKVADIEDAMAIMSSLDSSTEGDFRKTTHLELTLDSTNWDDWADDSWCIFLSNFAPLSDNLKKLTINVKGNVLFTRYNYFKAQIFTNETALVTDGSDDKQKVFNYQKRSRAETANSKDGANHISLSTHIPIPTQDKLKARAIPSSQVEMHLSEKLIVKQLLSLHKPIREIIIRGPIELEFRRYLIEQLNPRNWVHDNFVEAGFPISFREQIREVEA